MNEHDMYCMFLSFAVDEASPTMLSAAVSANIVNVLGEKPIATFPGRTDLESGKCNPQLRFFTEAEWAKIHEDLKRHYPSSFSSEYAEALQLIAENSAQCAISNGKLSIPISLAEKAEITHRTKMSLSHHGCYLEPISIPVDCFQGELAWLPEYLHSMKWQDNGLGIETPVDRPKEKEHE